VAARKERERRQALEALAGEALDDLGSEYNPFLDEGEGRVPDDEAAGLALAATIAGAGGGEDEDDANPFKAAGGKDDDESANPFLEEAGVLEESGEKS
jgi:hypothetical protein